MQSGAFYRLAADVILYIHVLFVAFVVLGLVAILTGRVLAWSWVRNPWFRVAHLGAIGVVAVQSWFGANCFLTVWEVALRRRAGDDVYPGAFVAHWLETLLYYEAPGWVFVVCYTLFFATVVFSWFWVRPRPFTWGKSDNATKQNAAPDA